MVGLDDFSLLSVIGKGCYGKVLLVRQVQTQEIFAMKIVKKSLLSEKNEFDHTLSERKILQRLNHPFIVKLKYAFQSSKKLYFILEYQIGGELFFHLARAQRFSLQRTKFYSACILLALEYLHKEGIMYREQILFSLKPENILIDSDGYPKICDFGLSKERTGDFEGGQTFCGTPEYMAPQIFLRVGHGKTVDMWSFGCLIYQMLVGVTPFFTQQTEQIFVKAVNEKIKFPLYFDQYAQDLILKLVEKDPQERLGWEEVKEHPWFWGIDWDGLVQRRIKSEFVPEKEAKEDLRYVSPDYIQWDTRDSVELDWEFDGFFVDGFTYTSSSLLND